MLIRTIRTFTGESLFFDPDAVFVFGDVVAVQAAVAFPGDGTGDGLVGVKFGGFG
jgi:hypothetical protein